jgi:hypothetical protein
MNGSDNGQKDLPFAEDGPEPEFTGFNKRATGKEARKLINKAMYPGPCPMCLRITTHLFCSQKCAAEAYQIERARRQ